MVGVVIVTHGALAGAFLETSALILGPVENVVAVGLDPEDSNEAMFERINEARRTVDSGDGVLILVDMFGGTPSNLSLRLLEPGKVEVLTGVNLPMLLKVGSERGQSLVEFAGAVREAGARNILVASEFLRSR